MAPDRHRVAITLYAIAAIALILAIGIGVRTAWLDPAAAYARAESAAAAGDYLAAIADFGAASGYRDADRRRTALMAEFAPYRAAYQIALSELVAGHPEQAIAVIAPVVEAVPTYSEAATLLAEARLLHTADLRRLASDAETRRDWIAAERALGELVASDPTDRVLAARLTALRRAHAPVVFTRDRALHLVGPDGADERLLTDAVRAAWPTWSPDRTRIAFTAQETGGGGIALYVINVDGSGLTRLAGDLRPYAGPVWSPDGSRLAYAAQGGGQELIGQTEPDPPSIRVVEVTTGRETNVTGGHLIDAFYPTWSPDGERLAFVSRAPDNGGLAAETLTPIATGAGEVFVATLSTGAIANLSRGRIVHPWRVAWSPVDDRLLVYTRDPGMSYDRDRAHVLLLDAVSGDLITVETGGETITTPVWSPDGTRIAYVAGERTVVIRDFGGEMSRFELDVMISRFLTWAPDGRTLLAVAETSGRASYLIPVDDVGQAPTPLSLSYDTDRRQPGSPQWAPIHSVDPWEPATVAGAALDPE